MASTPSPRVTTRTCRKCNGPCPPCAPWRCKSRKGRSLEECANDLEKTTLNRMQRVSLNVKQAIKDAATIPSASSTENKEQCKKSLSQGSIVSSSQAVMMSGENISGSNECQASAETTPVNETSSLPAQLSDLGSSHIFLAIAAHPALVKLSEALLNAVIEMPEVPEITSLEDNHCIWPHSVHLTIQAFGKVRNVDIPTIADYCKKNIKLMDLFYLNVKGMVHHEKLHAIGFRVEKQSVQPLRLFKSNMLNSCMAKWVNKNFSWERYEPVFGVLHSRSTRKSNFGAAPLSKRSIEIILKMFGDVAHTREVYPQRDIQLCLARSSTQTTFYKNLLE